MNTRLQQFLAAENITQAQFADSINVARPGISHIIAGRNKPGYDFIISTMNRYPDLNIEWLLTGKGKMYKSASPTAAQSSAVSPSDETSLFTIPEPEDNGLFASQETEISGTLPAQDAKKVFPEGKNSTTVPEKTLEVSVKQRKATKVVIFYDDGTFQEF